MKKRISISVVMAIAAFALLQSTLLSKNQTSPRRSQESAEDRKTVGGLASRPSARQSASENSPLSKSRLQDVKRITDLNAFKNPIWSPVDSKELVFVGLDGTYIESLGNGFVVRISGEKAGFKFLWTKGDQLVFREAIDEQQMALKSIAVRTGEVNVLAQSSDLSLPQEVNPGIVRYRDSNTYKQVSIAGQKGNAPNEGPFAYQFENDIFVSGTNRPEQINTDPGTYFLPQVSPDGTKVLYQEISRGLYVTDLLDGTTYYLGHGDDAVWSPDSRFVIFEVTTDKNDRVVGSDLYLADLQGRRRQLTATADLLEMRPSFSADGKYVAFDADGAIYVATLVEGE